MLYISPLKALAVDVERNLRAPLVGMRHAATRLGLPEPSVEVALRSGDTPAVERRRLTTKPPDILITTPESLFLILTSAARESLLGVETVIVDEVHAVAGTKRGAHLALSLERLDAMLDKPAQRIGLSATVRPVDEIARFLSGREAGNCRATAVGEDVRHLRRRAGRRHGLPTTRRPTKNRASRSGRTSKNASPTSSTRTARRSCSPTREGLAERLTTG